MTTGPFVSRLHHVAAEVSDMDCSIQFYRELIGMRVSERHAAHEVAEIPVELTFLRLHNNHHDLVLTHDPKKQYRPVKNEERQVGPAGFHHYAFECSDRDAWLQQLDRTEKMGVQIIRGPIVHSPGEGGDGSWGENESFYVLDPDGHRIEFFWDLGSVDEDGWICRGDGQNTGRRVDEL